MDEAKRIAGVRVEYILENPIWLRMEWLNRCTDKKEKDKGLAKAQSL